MTKKHDPLTACKQYCLAAGATQGNIAYTQTVSGNIMTTRWTYIFALTLLVNLTNGHNPFWVHLDKVLIKKTIRLDKNNPKDVEAFFLKNGDEGGPLSRPENLGFGWKARKLSIGGGYVSISAYFIYFQDSIISYILTPGIPEENRLKKRYKRWYTPFFPSLTNNVLPVRYNEELIQSPIKQYDFPFDFKAASDSVRRYMSPESGTLYGYRGELGYFRNRQAFIDIRKRLTKESVVLLMYSINPASRLTAIEYYMNHKQEFSNTNKIDSWIEIIFKELPNIPTLQGCIMRPVDSRQLVNDFRNIPED